MQFALGALTVLCFVLIIALCHIWAKLKNSEAAYEKIYVRLHDLFTLIEKLPPTSHYTIQLGLKDSNVAVGLDSAAALPIKPEDFRIKEEKLREKLLNGLATKKHPDTETQAWCILEHAGFKAYVDDRSRTEVQKALTRLLLNGNDEATRNFLESLAHSVCVSQ